MPLNVTVCHDMEERVWFVQASDLPGLNAEAASLDELIEVITDVAPDLIAANLPDIAFDNGDTSICIQHMVNAERARAA